MGLKVQMTSFRSHFVVLYYEYYVTPWMNSKCLLQRVTAISPKAQEVRIYVTYGVMMVKKKNKN